jgi:hypothetical protein
MGDGDGGGGGGTDGGGGNNNDGRGDGGTVLLTIMITFRSKTPENKSTYALIHINDNNVTKISTFEALSSDIVFCVLSSNAFVDTPHYNTWQRDTPNIPTSSRQFFDIDNNDQRMYVHPLIRLGKIRCNIWQSNRLCNEPSHHQCRAPYHIHNTLCNMVRVSPNVLPGIQCCNSSPFCTNKACGRSCQSSDNCCTF